MDNQSHLNITDLAMIKNLIDVACERGAFRAEEMTAVGQIYDKLTGFLKTVIEQAETATTNADDAEPKEKSND